MSYTLHRCPEWKAGKKTEFESWDVVELKAMFSSLLLKDYIEQGSGLLYFEDRPIAYFKYDPLDDEVKEYDLSDYIDDHVDNGNYEFSVRLFVDNQEVSDTFSLNRDGADIAYNQALDIAIKLNPKDTVKVEVYHTETGIVLNRRINN